jgi:aspartate aminotransferase
VADEVYREFTYDGHRAVSVLELEGHHDHVVMADSLSKRFSACGLRMGALVTRNRDLYDAFVRMAQGRLSPPGLGQLAATGAAELGEEYFRSLVAEYQARRDVLFAGLQGIPGVFLRQPEGAFYFVVRLPVADADDFARFLLADFSHRGATVMIAPAEGFYATPGLGRDEARIAYVLARPKLERAVEALAAALAAYAPPSPSRTRTPAPAASARS